MTRPTALVVGAGIGGLTAAWRLRQAGFAVEVFEREPRPSGRVKSIRLGGQTIDTGATAFLAGYHETLALIRELGLEDDLREVRGQVAIPRDGHLHLIDMDSPLKAALSPFMSWSAKLSLVRLLFRYLSVRKSLNFLSLGQANGQDRETLATYCKDRFPPEVYRYLLNPLIKFLYIHNGESGSLIELLWWIWANGSGKPRSLRLGTSSLTDALANNLSVQCGCDVTEVARQGQGVVLTVTSDDGDTQIHTADVCVVTVPGTIAALICKDGLTASQRDFLRTRRYDLSIVVSFVTRRKPDLDALMFMIPDELNADLATVIFGHNIGPDRSGADQGIVNAYFMKAWSDRHAQESDEVLMRAALIEVAKIVPEVTDSLAWNVQRWPYTAALTEIGDCQKIQAFEDEVDPTSPIQVIGDFLVQASMNVAVATANQAARRLIHQRFPGL